MHKLYKQDGGLPYGLIAILIFVGLHLEGLTDTNANQVPIMREFWFLQGLLLAAFKLEQIEKSGVVICGRNVVD